MNPPTSVLTNLGFVTFSGTASKAVANEHHRHRCLAESPARLSLYDTRMNYVSCLLMTRYGFQYAYARHESDTGLRTGGLMDKLRWWSMNKAAPSPASVHSRNYRTKKIRTNDPWSTLKQFMVGFGDEWDYWRFGGTFRHIFEVWINDWLLLSDRLTFNSRGKVPVYSVHGQSEFDRNRYLKRASHQYIQKYIHAWFW